MTADEYYAELTAMGATDEDAAAAVEHATWLTETGDRR
jgi:hypothetical protein